MQGVRPDADGRGRETKDDEKSSKTQEGVVRLSPKDSVVPEKL